ncbi:MAG TPA: hypothetical protein VIS06_12610 [Mycobacteriales bacterium]|jgi:hypothetical protein
MLSFATTTVSILGGSGTDEFGDPVDGTTVAASGVPASLVEVSRTVRDPTDPTPRIVRFTACRLPYGTAVTTANRIKDETTQAIYVIDSTTPPANPVFGQDIRLDLRKTTT